jgi:uncharacterized protein (TIGR02145 family)
MLPKSIFLAVIIFLHNVNVFAQQFNSNLTYGEVKDIEGNTYKTIKIGTQTWMAENLRTTKYNDGTNIPIVTDSAQWLNNRDNGNLKKQSMMCWYNNDRTTYAAKYGALYNWYAINPGTNGNKNVCPTGWHVPTDAEWTTLINYLDPHAEGGDKWENVAGGKMKSTGTDFWVSPNTDATNSSGFSGLPGGYRGYNGSFYRVVGFNGYWWSSSEYYTSDAWYRILGCSYGDVYRSYHNKTYGFSVRCLRN